MARSELRNCKPVIVWAGLIAALILAAIIVLVSRRVFRRLEELESL